MGRAALVRAGARSSRSADPRSSLRPSCELIETLRGVSLRASFRQGWLVVLLSVTIWVLIVRLVLVVAYSFAG